MIKILDQITRKEFGARTCYSKDDVLKVLREGLIRCPNCKGFGTPIILNFLKEDLDGVSIRVDDVDIYPRVITNTTNPIKEWGIRVIFDRCACRGEAKEAVLKEFQQRQERRKIQELFSESMMTEKFEEYTFKNWEKSPESKPLQEIAKNYVHKWGDNFKDGMGLIVYSKTKGNGKSHMTGAIANYLLGKGVPVVFVNVPELIDKIHKSWGGKEDEWTIKNQLQNCHLLVLDDLGAQKYTEHREEELYKIINGRYNRKRPIIATSNCDIDELAQNIGERSFSRLVETCLTYENPLPNFRIEIAKRRMKGNI